MLPVDALGFRRGAGALKTLLADQGLADHPLFAQAKGRGIRALSGHIESTDLTNDVNGGPSGVGIATAAGKAAFWDIVGAPMGDAEDHRVRGRVRDDRGPRAGAQDPGDRAAGRQAAADLPLRQQRRHRRFADRRRRVQQVRRLPPGRSVDLVRLERLHAAGRPRLRPDRRRAEDDGGLGPGGSAADDRHRQDHQGLLAAARSNGKIPGAGDQVVGYPEPSVRDEDELGVLRRAGADVREALRRGVRRASARAR